MDKNQIMLCEKANIVIVKMKLKYSKNDQDTNPQR